MKDYTRIRIRPGASVNLKLQVTDKGYSVEWRGRTLCEQPTMKGAMRAARELFTFLWCFFVEHAEQSELTGDARKLRKWLMRTFEPVTEDTNGN